MWDTSLKTGGNDSQLFEDNKSSWFKHHEVTPSGFMSEKDITTVVVKSQYGASK